MKTRDDILVAANAAREQLESGISADEILSRLRADGFGQVASSQVIRFALSIPLREAKSYVFRSEVWRDKRRSWATAQERAARAVQEQQH
jgi:hypothetical protein